MSIRRQLALGIGLLMLVIMGGNLFMNILQLQSHYEQQLKARADETATTMALSMTQSANLEDDAVLRSMIDVVFDRGHFAVIRFDYVDQDRAVQRVAGSNLSSAVPIWFRHMLPLYAQPARAYVSQGWQQLGELTVRLHAGEMHLQLWRLVKAEVAWFALMAFIAIYGLRLMLNWQLKPLKDILEMSEKLANNQFVHIEKAPKARELKSLVSSMNTLSDRLHDSFVAHGETIAKLQQDNFSDALTQLNNRKGWDQFLGGLMKVDNFTPGWMLLLQVENLSELNQNHGKALVDELLIQMALCLKTDPILNIENVCLARSNGGEFWVFAPDTLDQKYSNRLHTLEGHLLNLSLVQQYHAVLRMSAIPVGEVIASASIKHQLDMLLRRGKSQQETLMIGQVENHTLINWSHWQNRLDEALNKGGVELYAQSLFNGKGQEIQQEIHCRLKHGKDEPLLAAYFWPMVEKLGMAVDFDRLVIEKWIAHFHEIHNTRDWVLNLSGSSLNDEGFRTWFEMQLSHAEKHALIIEFSEYTLAHSSEAAQKWLHNITQQGIRLSVDHVGTSGKSFGFLSRFPLYQGKVERRFIRDIHLQKENAFFVSGMVQVFHTRQTLCFAEGVESEKEKDVLLELGVDGVMGYGLAKPEPLVTL